jgi:hypothetical protein
MKTDKLLQLIQQKKFMRSGGALPLPKAVTGNEGQCDPKTEYWDPKLKRCIPRNNPFLQYNIQDAYDYAKKYNLELDDESKKYIDEHYVTADPRWLADTYNTGRLDEKGKEVWEDIPFIKKMDDLASKNLGVSDWNKELCPCSNHAEGSHYDNTKYTPEYKQRISTMMNKDPEATRYFLAKCGCFRGEDKNFSKETTVDNPEYMDKLKSKLKNQFDSPYSNSWHSDTDDQNSEAYDFLRNLYPDKDSNDLYKEAGDMTAVYTKDMVDDEGNVRDEYARQYYDRDYTEDKGVKELADIVTSGYYNAQPATRYFQVKQEGNSDKPWENKYFVSQQGEGMVDNQGLKKWNPITSEFSTPNELGTWHTIGYNEYQRLKEQEDPKGMVTYQEFKRQGGPLPKAQIGLFPSLFNQNTSTQNTKKEPAAPPKNLTPYEQLVNSYNTYNDTYKQSFNKLNTWPKFSGETIELTNGRYKGTKVPVEYFNMLNDSARRFKLDPYTLFAIAGRESTLGQDPRYKNRNANPMTLVSGWDVAEPYQPYTLDRYLADQRVPGVTSSKDFHGYYYKINDQNQVNAYLAKHPEIVNGYIKKLQSTPKLTYTNPFDLISKFIIDKGISRYNPGQKEYSKLINNEIVSLKKEKNLSNFLLKHKEEGGSLTEYQKKGQTGLPKGYMSYQSNPEWFDNRAVYHDNERFNDTIRKLVYSGKAAYNPETGALHFINGKPADAATQQMATEDYTRGVRRDPTNPEYAGADQRTKQIIQNTTEQAYQNPLMYAPGMIGMSMLPTTWGMGYGLGSSLAQFGQGNYRDAAIGAGLSLLPFAQPTILKNQVIPRVLSSDIVGNYVSPKITNRIFERNISPANWSNYATESIGKGGFGEAHTFKNFPNHVWKVSNSGKTAGLFDVDFNKLRFEKIIPKPYGTEHPNYIKTFIGNPTISTDNNYELMTRVPGSPLRDLNWQQMNEIPQESWQQLHRTLDRLRQNDVGVDLVGKNILYDQPSKQFGVIDLTPGMSEMMPDDIDWVFGGMHKSLNADQAKTRILENIASQVKRAGHINKGRGLQNLTGLNSDEFLILLDEYRNANYNNKQYKDFVLDKINNLKRRGGQLRKAALGNEGEDPLEQAKKWLMAHSQQAAPQTKQTLDLSRNAVNANNKFTSKDAQKSDKAYIQSTNAQAMLQAQQAESERINKLAKENNMSPMDVVLAEKRYKADRQKRAAELEAGAPFREVSLFGKPSDTQLGFPTPDAYATGLKNPFNWPTYALGAYYGGAALGAAGELAYPYVGPAFTSIFETPAVIGGRTVPWLTGNNILGLEMATNTPGNIERGEYGQALLNTMPFWLNSTTMNLAGKTYGATRNLFAEAANKGRNLFNDARIATAEGANKFGKALKENVVVDALNFKNLRKKYDAAYKAEMDKGLEANVLESRLNTIDHELGDKTEKIFREKFSNNIDPDGYNFTINQEDVARQELDRLERVRNEENKLKQSKVIDDNNIIVNEPSALGQSLKTGDAQVFDFATGEFKQVTVQNPAVNESTKFTLEGNKVTESTTSGSEIKVDNSAIVNANKGNVAWVENATGGKVFGSSRGVADAGLVHIPDDVEVLITRKNYDKNVANKYPKTAEEANVVKHDLVNGKGMSPKGNKGEVGFVIIEEGKNGKAVGKRAQELFRQGFPDEYKAAVEKAVKNGKSEIDIPYTPEELLNKVSPEVKTVMDSMEINAAGGGFKGKHTLRPDAYINYGDVKVVAEAQEKFVKSLVGSKGTVGPQFEASQLSDVEKNMEILQKIGFKGDMNAVANSAERMQLALNDYYINKTVLSRGVHSYNLATNKSYTLKEFIDSFAKWDPEAGGGMMMGAGQNFVALGDSGYGPYYGHKQAGLNIFEKDPLDFVTKVEQMTNGLLPFTPEEKTIANNILSKYGAQNHITINNPDEFLGAVRTMDPKNMKKALSDYSDLTGKRVIHTSQYSHSIWGTTLKDFDETLDAISYSLGDMPRPTSKRLRNEKLDYLNKNTEFDIGKATNLNSWKLSNKTSKDAFYMMRNKINDATTKVQGELTKTEAKIKRAIQTVENFNQEKRNIHNRLKKLKGKDYFELEAKIEKLNKELSELIEYRTELYSRINRARYLNDSLGKLALIGLLGGVGGGAAYGLYEVSEKQRKEDQARLDGYIDQYESFYKSSTDEEFKKVFGLEKRYTPSTYAQFMLQFHNMPEAEQEKRKGNIISWQNSIIPRKVRIKKQK